MELTSLHLQALYELLAMHMQQINRLTQENQELRRQHQILSTDQKTGETPNGIYRHESKSEYGRD